MILYCYTFFLNIPKQKNEITAPMEAELEATRKGLSRDVFGIKLKDLKHDVALGRGCLRNNHPIALNINPGR